MPFPKRGSCMLWVQVCVSVYMFGADKSASFELSYKRQFNTFLTQENQNEYNQ
jgi:uncharacterized BrkB/YihY/UPF0761 family membrane protein